MEVKMLQVCLFPQAGRLFWSAKSDFHQTFCFILFAGIHHNGSDKGLCSGRTQLEKLLMITLALFAIALVIIVAISVNVITKVQDTMSCMIS